MCDTSFKAPQNLFPPFYAPSQKNRCFGAGRICGNSWLWRYRVFFIWGDSVLPRESDNGRSRRNGRLLHFYRNGKEGYVALAGQKQARLEKQDADLATSGPPQQSTFNAIFPLYNLRLLTRNLHFFFSSDSARFFFAFLKRFLRPFIASWWKQLALDCQAEEGKGRSRVVGLFSRTLLKTGRKGKKKEFRTVAAQCRDRIKSTVLLEFARYLEGPTIRDSRSLRFQITLFDVTQQLSLSRKKSIPNGKWRSKYVENSRERKEKREKMAENGRGKNSPLAILRIAWTKN